MSTQNTFTPAVIREATESIIVARISLLFKQPFYGNLAARLPIKLSDNIRSAATDGRSLIFNPAFIKTIDKDELVFAVAHEVQHIVMDTFDRKGDRIHLPWNIATDYANNRDLIESKVGKFKTDWLYDKKYDGMTAEQIYDSMLPDYEKNKEKYKLLGDRLLDDHLEPDHVDNEVDKLSPGEIQGIQDGIREALINAAASCDPGQVPGNIRRLIGNFTEPKMDWKQIIYSTMESQIKNDFSYKKLSRRSSVSDFIFPCQLREEKIQVHIAFDTSGSCTQKMITDMLGEVVAMASMYGDYEINLMCFDTAIYNYQTYTEEDGIITDYQMSGGGGTNVNAVFDYFKLNDIVPKQLIVFSDLYFFGGDGDPDYCPTLWLSIGNDKIMPYGETIKFM